MVTPSRTKNSKFSEFLGSQKWPTLVALPVLVVATINNLYSIWGVLFIYWGLRSLFSGDVYLVESIERDKNPILFWIITAMWIGFGILYIFADFYPEYYP